MQNFIIPWFDEDLYFLIESRLPYHRYYKMTIYSGDLLRNSKGLQLIYGWV